MTKTILASIFAIAALMIGTATVPAMAEWTYGTEEQKQQYLVPLASGQKLGSFCLTKRHSVYFAIAWYKGIADTQCILCIKVTTH